MPTPPAIARASEFASSRTSGSNRKRNHGPAIQRDFPEQRVDGEAAQRNRGRGRFEQHIHVLGREAGRDGFGLGRGLGIAVDHQIPDGFRKLRIAGRGPSSERGVTGARAHRLDQVFVGVERVADLENSGEQSCEQDQGERKLDQRAAGLARRALHSTNLGASGPLTAMLEAATFEESRGSKMRRNTRGAGALATTRTKRYPAGSRGWAVQVAGSGAPDPAASCAKLSEMSETGLVPRSHFMAWGPLANPEAESRARRKASAPPSSSMAPRSAAASVKACSSLWITYMRAMSIASAAKPSRMVRATQVIIRTKPALERARVLGRKKDP